MTWPVFPQRLQSALKALCFLAHCEGPVQSWDIADHIGVSRPETAKVLQLLAWGGFVKSRRGSKGGFQLERDPALITTGEVIDFFHAKQSAEPDTSSPVMRRLMQAMAPCQKAFGDLTLAEVGVRERVRKQKTDDRRVNSSAIRQRGRTVLRTAAKN